MSFFPRLTNRLLMPALCTALLLGTASAHAQSEIAKLDEAIQDAAKPLAWYAVTTGTIDETGSLVTANGAVIPLRGPLRDEVAAFRSQTVTVRGTKTPDALNVASFAPGTSADFEIGELDVTVGDGESTVLFFESSRGRLLVTGDDVGPLTRPTAQTREMVETFRGAQLILRGLTDAVEKTFDLNATEIMVRGRVYSDGTSVNLLLPSGKTIPVTGPAAKRYTGTRFGDLVWVTGSLDTASLRASYISRPVATLDDLILPPYPYPPRPRDPLLWDQLDLDYYEMFPGWNVDRIASSRYEGTRTIPPAQIPVEYVTQQGFDHDG